MGDKPNHPITGHHHHHHQQQQQQQQQQYHHQHYSMVTTTTMALLFLTQYPSIVRGFRPSIVHTFHPLLPTTTTSSSLFSSSTTTTNNETDPSSTAQTPPSPPLSSSSPWTQSQPPPIQTQPKGINKSRFRQHVNPLSRKFQTPTDLPPSWPYHTDGYQDPSLPLHIDVGCGKGGFLLSLASSAVAGAQERRNYLGLEIRPHVASYARSRLLRRDEHIRNCVDFVGCNVNVDLARLLSLYTAPSPNDDNGEKRVGGTISLVSIQFPDPHFKKKHEKRKVVTPEFVEVLAEFLEEGTKVFLQSDIKDVLDAMREAVADGRRRRLEGDEGSGSVDTAYFVDCSPGTYLKDNPIGVPTEREVSVLEKGGEVYRVMFQRSDVPYGNAE